MRVRVLGDPRTVEALRLAGIAGRGVESVDEGRQALEEMMADAELGLLLVTEPLARSIGSQVVRAKLTGRFPLVLEIPARGLPASAADDLVERIARLVGVRVDGER